MVTKHNLLCLTSQNSKMKITLLLCKHITYIMSFNPYMNSRS